MSSRSFRLETRSRARDEIKRIMQTVEKVRKWEKIWIETGLSNHLKVYKWVPVRDDGKKVEENEPEPGKTGEQTRGNKNDTTLPEILPGLPEILPAKDLGTSLEPAQLASGPPDLLLESETSSQPPPPSSGGQGSNSTPDEVQEKVDFEKRRERQTLKDTGKHTVEHEDRPRSPHQH
ncbi:B-cell CLL/lymphoma 7 protein family member A [Geodia barretti]|uniref:B-cell CLL/lymphoma 7 protein family member A n=1 Tax=Geodia barretti TaxID=519541 RepID=A0AA35S6T4_GEOBA|nr:B-cell CLL/lymphoma 7 protein family member A [Geodia barretti]